MVVAQLVSPQVMLAPLTTAMDAVLDVVARARKRARLQMPARTLTTTAVVVAAIVVPLAVTPIAAVAAARRVLAGTDL